MWCPQYRGMITTCGILKFSKCQLANAAALPLLLQEAKRIRSIYHSQSFDVFDFPFIQKLLSTTLPALENIVVKPIMEFDFMPPLDHPLDLSLDATLQPAVKKLVVNEKVVPRVPSFKFWSHLRVLELNIIHHDPHAMTGADIVAILAHTPHLEILDLPYTTCSHTSMYWRADPESDTKSPSAPSFLPFLRGAGVSGPLDFVKTVMSHIEAPNLQELRITTGIPPSADAPATINAILSSRHRRLLDRHDTLYVHRCTASSELYIGDHDDGMQEGPFSLRLYIPRLPDTNTIPNQTEAPIDSTDTDLLSPALAILTRVFHASPLRNLHLVGFIREQEAPASAWGMLFTTFGTSLRSLEIRNPSVENVHAALDALEARAREDGAESITPLALSLSTYYVRNSLVMHDLIAHLLLAAGSLDVQLPPDSDSSDAPPSPTPGPSCEGAETGAGGAQRTKVRVLHSVTLAFQRYFGEGEGTGMQLDMHRWMLLALAYRCRLRLSVRTYGVTTTLRDLFTKEELRRITENEQDAKRRRELEKKAGRRV